MTKYFVTAWCQRPFYGQCEVEAETPQKALEKARVAIHDAPAEECDQGYYWDEWRVDTQDQDGVLFHLDEEARLNAAARRMLAALQAAALREDVMDGELGDLISAALAEATGHPMTSSLPRKVMLAREDMLVELSSDMVSTVEQLINQDDYRSLHSWLQPIFIKKLKADFPTDDSLAAHYESQLGKAPDRD